jgi:hypothetical protein
MCNRCTSTGRICDGYAKPVPKKPRKQNSKRAQELPLLLPSKGEEDFQLFPEDGYFNFNDNLFLEDSFFDLLEPTGPTYIPRDLNTFLPDAAPSPTTLRSIEYFHHRAAPHISGLDNPEFWRRISVQLGRSEPVIRNAIIAVSTAFETTENPGADEDAALRAYDKAVNGAVKMMNEYVRGGKREDLALVVTSILFAALEYIKGDVGAFLKHVHGGLKIWDGLTGPSPPTPSLCSSSATSTTLPSPSPPRSPSVNALDAETTDELSSIFDRLRLQTAVTGGPRPGWTEVLDTNALGSNFGDEIPLIFTSMTEAKRHFFTTLHQIMSLESGPFSASKILQHSIVHQNVVRKFQQWRAAFDGFCDGTQGLLSREDEKMGKVLSVNALASHTYLETFHSDEEVAYDAFKAEYEAALRIAEDLVNTALQSDKKSDELSSFNLGLIPGLHHIAIHCRFPMLRRKAIQLLASTHWSEGIFDSTRSAKLGQCIMEVEEGNMKGICNDGNLPREEDRVKHFEFAQGEGKVGMEVLCMYMKKGDGEQWQIKRELWGLRHQFGRAGGLVGKEEKSGAMNFEEFRKVVNCQ